MEATQKPLKLNVKRTMLIGFAFFGILLLWQVYDSWCPTFLSELFAKASKVLYDGKTYVEWRAINDVSVFGAAAVDDEIADDRCAANDTEEALEVGRAVDNHVLYAVSSAVEGAVVLESGVEADGRMCVHFALIVNVGSQKAVDGGQMSIVDHSGEPLHVGCAAQFEEAVGSGQDVVLHELSADGAPAIHIVMLWCRRRILVAVGHFA